MKNKEYGAKKSTHVEDDVDTEKSRYTEDNTICRALAQEEGKLLMEKEKSY